MQKFIAREKRTNPNGAIQWAPGGPMDCVGPWAKVQNCPVVVGAFGDKEVHRLTCYATGYANTAFSVPACTRYKGKYIAGYFTMTEMGPEFRVMDRHAHYFADKH